MARRNFTSAFLLSIVIFLLLLNSLSQAKRRHRRSKNISGIDLLRGLKLSSKKQLTETISTKGVKFTDGNSGEITYIDMKKVLRRKRRELTVEFIGYSSKHSLATLFGIYLKDKPLPLIEVSLHLKTRQVILRYLGDTSFQRVSLTFGEEINNWTVLSATVSKKSFTVNVGCKHSKSAELHQPLSKFPKQAFGIISSGKYGENKFVGQLFQARLYNGAVKPKSLMCAKKVNLVNEEGYQNDATVNGDRILLLEQQITQLNNMVDMLKLHNAELTNRVGDLEEDCLDCVQTACMWNGRMFQNGETWNQDKCLVCICKNSQPDCLIRTDIPSCQAPCNSPSNPCQNQGQCVSYDESSPEAYQCMCKPPYDGPSCEYKENPCVWPQEPGICDQNLPRFYYDLQLQECREFNYTGCGGNINNYMSLDECNAVAVIGACCFRQYSLKVEDVIVSSQQEKFDCKNISLSECQATHRQVVGDSEIEVISFYPGVTCGEAECGVKATGCAIDGRRYDIGERAIVGCQECRCESSGQFVCSCSQKAVRKEIRDMTAQELAQFQAAVQELRLIGPGNPWEELRDLYMRHTMHSNGGPYFLPWHRVFLRKLEQKLQEIDCGITLPYYDFSTDVGNFEDAIIWQPNYFGGDGVDGCVPDHPFGHPGSWRPCIRRNFNPDIELPTMIELSLALASEDYTELSMCLESYVSYIHTYIGGDMATRGASYDPVFYSIHAYIDMLYWWWQQKGSNKFKYPAAFGNIPMVPFNIPPSAILDLESDLCVSYLPPSKGNPCNLTEAQGTDTSDPNRGDIIPEGEGVSLGGFNALGYNDNGFDRRQFDRYGFKNTGYNRDGYDKKGYDMNGFDRYGYDADGYSHYGYDVEGWDRNNEQDLTGTFNSYGLDMNCLDRRGLTTEGFDQYGFSKKGFDMGHCNFFLTGPFATIQSNKIWQILNKQTKTFLMTLERTCPGLEPLPTNWLQQYWITDIKDVIGLVPMGQSRSQVHNSARFCFDIDDFVTSCGCDVGIATCEDNPCKTNTCPSYPEATCRVDFCGACTARWFFNGVEVDCSADRDFCEPNPCQNGGTCVPSIWPNEPQLTTCLCPPEFEGHRCQYEALHTCEMPLSSGKCEDQILRWFFDPFSQTCKTFVYTGCHGNSNNFLSKEACENRCKIGACCYRFPKNKGMVIGYDSQMYDAYGFNIEGTNRRGDIRIEDNGIKTAKDRYGESRYDWQGYDRNGYDRNGFDHWGLDKEGYDIQGFNLTGYSKQGEFDGIIDYDKLGYDLEGYNRAGFTCYGTSRTGVNALSVFAEYEYRCRSATLAQCQRIEERDGNQVVKFSRGKRCEEVNCVEQCGCNYNNQTYKLGESFRAGCQYCKCSLTGTVECSCNEIYRRKEVRDMSQEELKKYQDAVQMLNKNPTSDWVHYADIYAQYRPQAVGSNASLPWMRQFLKMVEQNLQAIDCSITIPYYDWTVNAGNQHRAAVWAANIFGGNGVDNNDCVLHHPFKDYYPPYWVPCLRRRFNNSIQLPDVVDIQYALNEPDYERFRVSMEVYLDIFKSWMGGHMDSDYSAYDPVFLSVAAFVDRIWWDWQSKHANGLLRYPQHLRYIPMMPFRSTPDDVMDSKKQMCVTYFPLTEGAACNVTFPNLNYDSMGYNRHGFNREGYDREGYNMFGLDKDNNTDNRGIFNIYGYDRQGFKRNGYDSLGWDRFGFSMDYNVDGYNSLGFDKSGYNRYGFDKYGITPFGFHRNGTHLIFEDAYLFDTYGYNRYGYDRYGFDRSGYDVFGFDATGYDKNQCNRYNLGPMLVIIKRWSEIELEKANNGTIRIITRICPPVSKMPEYRYFLNWMRRGEQVPLIEGILGRAQARSQGLSPDVRSSSVTEQSLWLPVGPDRSLCFVTYYYEECPFGVIPIECPQDLCQNRVCPDYPDAVCRVTRCGSCDYEWYNGRTGAPIQCSGCVDRYGVTQAEGSTWRTSECETCSCIDGLVSCYEMMCPPVTCTHPVKIPGQCCIQCDAGCDYNGLLYENRQTFSPSQPSCVDCVCSGGSVTCDPKPCPIINCVSTTILEGECCPTCLDCGDHINGEVWKETPCQECTCVDGSVNCERIQCIPPDCSHPAVPPGECCPNCDSCNIQGRILQEGESYLQDQCTECICSQGNIRCDPVPCLVPNCLLPVTIPGDCCPSCNNDCEYNRRRYRHSQSFLSSEDSCTNCTCDNTRISCSPVTCPRMNLPCRRPVTYPGDCCPSACPTCFADGREYETGARWTSLNDPCETCLCEEGIPSCQRQDRCPVQCDHGVTPPDQCCSKCTDCNFNGLVVNNGQTFVRPGDNCQQCTCNNGDVSCVSLGPCPILPCRVTETPPGACCPQCVRCEYQGHSYSHFDVVPSDQCFTCRCRDGQIQCDRVSCPEVQCLNPVTEPGQCCPVCRECDYKGQTYQPGQRFTPLDNPCMDCLCSASGKLDCIDREDECPRQPCTHPIKSQKQCCPTCEGCSFMRRRFRNGQKFIPPGNDNCKVCKCDQGSVECSSMRCPAVNCHNAVLVKGQCCPVCPMGCNVMGIEYRDGQTFIDFMDRCQVCTCMMGEIRCMAMMSCPAITCTHPANRPGNCCPSCTMCEQNAVQYANRETFINPADKCQQCTCRDGSITCELKSSGCAPVNCINPMLDPVSCCPVCQSKPCMYAGRQYQEGQLVPASRDRCDVCTCTKGMVDCARTQCPEVTCLHPYRDECCLTCEFCEYNGMRFELGEMFPNPYSACEDCVCQAGTVDCHRRGCDPPNCRDPVYEPGACCPVCSDCTFQGMLYLDGQNFQNPASPCETCHCMKGNVACDRWKCPQVNCQNPIIERCCPVCKECMYNKISYRNLETFTSPDGCGQCTCRNGNISCDQGVCPPVTCRHPVESGCCKLCTDCFYQNRLFKNGQSFREADNECNRCTCQDGTMSCDPLPCPPVTCDSPVRGRCCMECQNCDHNGRIVRHGDRFWNETDQCSECQCRYGTIQCSRRQCPAAKCANPVMRDCCPVCLITDDCEYNGRQFSHGDRFVDGADPCSLCQCMQGTIRCSRQPCPEVKCSNPVLESCCGVCTGSCVHGNQTYSHGDRFPSVTQPCEDCVCNQGTVDCRKKSCLPLACSHPIRDETRCCPECTDCLYDNRVIRHGGRFIEDCQDCVCSAGNIQCRKRQCPEVTCLNPTIVSCCPTCETCTQDGRQYGEGATIQDKRDSCSTCTCQGGTFLCERRSCPALTCLHPAQGQCCPECRHCQIGARKMLHGDIYPDLDDKCSTCVCQSGTITCSRRVCSEIRCSDPVLDDCGCGVCGQGCLYKGVTMETGQVIQDPRDRCDTCTCRGGNVQCTREPCSTSCSHPADGDGCCPLCRSCIYEDQIQVEGSTFTPRDRCQTCSCQRGNVTCSRVECPALDCESTQVQPGECCPSCATCYDLSTSITYYEGDVWAHKDNPCLTCMCQGGSPECREVLCPALDCKRDEKPVNVPGQCCLQCHPRDGNSCQHHGEVKPDWSEWWEDKCTQCRCVDGDVQCTTQTCVSQNCNTDQVPIFLPGICCPICITKPATCTVFGDPHYNTFDGEIIHFQGTCKYVMARDCQRGDFSLEVQHDDRGVKGVSWAQNFTFMMAHIRVDILQGYQVLVNNRRVNLPYVLGTSISVELLGDSMLLNTRLGVQLLWDGRSHAELSVPGRYKRRMCGLCGDFNGFPRDDMKTRQGNTTQSSAEFGNSWKADNQLNDKCEDGTDGHTCDGAMSYLLREANSHCEILFGESFQACSRVIPSLPYFASCVYDYCACKDKMACLCEIFSSYARECSRAGIRLEWRNQTLCAMECEVDKGFIFDECGPVCPRTCDNWESPLGVLTEACYKPCIHGCQCPADKVVHNGRCVSPQQCPDAGR